jgi:hypothetical protein
VTVAGEGIGLGEGLGLGSNEGVGVGEGDAFIVGFGVGFAEIGGLETIVGAICDVVVTVVGA